MSLPGAALIASRIPASVFAESPIVTVTTLPPAVSVRVPVPITAVLPAGYAALASFCAEASCRTSTE